MSFPLAISTQGINMIRTIEQRHILEQLNGKIETRVKVQTITRVNIHTIDAEMQPQWSEQAKCWAFAKGRKVVRLEEWNLCPNIHRTQTIQTEEDIV